MTQRSLGEGPLWGDAAGKGRMKRPTVWAAVGLICCCAWAAQGQYAGDSVALAREFGKLSTAHFWLPLQAKVVIVRKSDLVTAPEDTARVEAEYWLDSVNAYFRAGDVEQILDDSLALLVNHRLGRIFYGPARPGQLMAFLGVLRNGLPDSSVAALFRKYAVARFPDSAGLGRIALTERKRLFGTDMPKGSVTLVYQKQKGLPLRIELLERGLVPLPDSGAGHPSGNAGRTLKLEGRSFLVRESWTVAEYRSVAHDTGSVLPAKISDRLLFAPNGTALPAKGFEGFLLVNKGRGGRQGNSAR